MVSFSWNEQEQIRLVQSDYDKTLEFMRHGLRTMFQLRAVAIALTLALIGFAVQQNLAALAIVAAVFTVVFFAADWYQARQYSEAAHHLRASKTTAAAYYRVLSEAGEPRPRREFTQLLADHELGLAPEVKGSRTVYVSLLAVATASALAVGLLHAGKQPAKIEQPNQEQVDKVSIEALTSEIRAQLSQLAARLQQSARPADQHLGTEIARDVAAGGSLLVAGGGLLAAVKLAGTAPEAIAGKVLGDITGELFKEVYRLPRALPLTALTQRGAASPSAPTSAPASASPERQASRSIRLRNRPTSKRPLAASPSSSNSTVSWTTIQESRTCYQSTNSRSISGIPAAC